MLDRPYRALLNSLRAISFRRSNVPANQVILGSGFHGFLLWEESRPAIQFTRNGVEQYPLFHWMDDTLIYLEYPGRLVLLQPSGESSIDLTNVLTPERGVASFYGYKDGLFLNLWSGRKSRSVMRVDLEDHSFEVLPDAEEVHCTSDSPHLTIRQGNWVRCGEKRFEMLPNPQAGEVYSPEWDYDPWHDVFVRIGTLGQGVHLAGAKQFSFKLPFNVSPRSVSLRPSQRQIWVLVSGGKHYKVLAYSYDGRLLGCLVSALGPQQSVPVPTDSSVKNLLLQYFEEYVPTQLAWPEPEIGGQDAERP
jgi:hypothetical protein